MLITPLEQTLIPGVEELISFGGPYIRLRTSSDYWLYAHLFSTTCQVAVDNGQPVGVIIAFRSQDNPDDIYIQDVMTHPNHRRRGITGDLINTIRHQAETWGCKRLYLTSEPANSAAHATWLALGFANLPVRQPYFVINHCLAQACNGHLAPKLPEVTDKSSTVRDHVTKYGCSTR